MQARGKIETSLANDDLSLHAPVIWLINQILKQLLNQTFQFSLDLKIFISMHEYRYVVSLLNLC